MTDDPRTIVLRPTGEITISATPPVALTIAGSDSGGGAGIAADLKTFAALGVFGTVAVTALTAQDTTKVHGVMAATASFVDLQLDAVLGDFPVAAAKTGMLTNLSIIDRVAERARDGRLPTLVVDPVMVASSGASLVDGDAHAAYRRLIAHAAVVTPNLPEASLLLGRVLENLDDMVEAARELVELGAGLAVVKGGHLSGPTSIDVVFDGSEVIELVDDRVATSNVHGTGCTLSAAIAAHLALGRRPLDAVIEAKRYVGRIIRASAALELGYGPGPLDHFAPVAPGARGITE